MFGKKKSAATPLVLGQEKFDTLIGRHAEVQGNLHLHESIRIDGRVLGHVHSAADQGVSVVVGPTGGGPWSAPASAWIGRASGRGRV